jgi:hypothetical protein
MLINAIFSCFSRGSLIDYLDIMYKIIIENKIEERANIDIRVYLCAFHFIKLVKRRIKEKLNTQKIKANRTQIDYFMNCIRLLQNSKSTDEFNTFLASIFVVFNYEKENETCRRHKKLLDKNINRLEEVNKSNKKGKFNLNKEETNPFSKLNEQESSASEKPFQYYKKQETEIISKSKFTSFYDELVQRFTNEMREDINKDMIHLHEKANDLFSPTLFAVVLVFYLNIMPLWSGCALWDMEGIIRLTNNYIESWFMHLKHNILNKQEYLMPSEFIGLLFDHIRSLFLLFYKEKFEDKTGK